MKRIPIFLLTPNNFSHKAGDGLKTRKREIRIIHPALQATPGGTQCTYLLECWKYKKGENMKKEKIVCEKRMDEGLRTFKGDIIGTIRTIDSGGDKRVIEKIDILGNYSPSGYESSRVVSRGSISPTVKENHGTTTGIVDMDNSDTGYRIRKLTPKECWKLMGFSDEAFEKAKAAGVSNSQLYKQAGNSIVTDVLYHIFKELYVAMPYLFNNLKVGSYFSGIGAFEVGLNRLFNDINNSSMQTYFAPSGGKEVIIYDDYNSRIRKNQNTMGTITTMVGSSSLRNSYKLIEEYNE